MTADSFPLAWPNGWKRTPADRRKSGKNSNSGNPLSVAKAVDRVFEELRQYGIAENDIIISTNIRPTLSGVRPRSSEAEPTDPGAAVYWTDRLTGKPQDRVIAVDAYATVATNLAGIAATLNAFRAVERHGGAEILDRAFTGFTALPPPAAAVPTEWWVVLEVPRTAPLEDIRKAFRRQAARAHPDKGGNDAWMAAVNGAWEAAQRERG